MSVEETAQGVGDGLVGIVGVEQHSEKAGDAADLGAAHAFDEPREHRKKARRITTDSRRLSRSEADLARGHRKASDRIHDKEDVLALVAEVFGDKVRAVPSEQLIEEGWFGPGRSHPELAARIGDYTLQMRERYTISDRLAGERELHLNGVHGGTSAAEMIVPLMLAGA